MIIVEDLTKQFDEFLAVDSLKFSVKSGQVLVIMGPNGAGKTTTMRMLSSILKPTRGSAKVAGYDVVHQAQSVRKAVGVLTEHHGLYGRMSLGEYLDFFGGLYNLSKKETRKRAAPLIDKFNLSNAVDKRLGEFSKGMRQKLALVRALLHDPPVLLLDEPTSAMDPESSRTVRNSINGLRSSDRAIILCTHNLTEAEELADLVAIIYKGRIIFQGTIPDVKSKLLGVPEFIARIKPRGLPWNAENIPGINVISNDSHEIRLRVQDPEISNPMFVNSLVSQGFELISLQESPRSLEQAYLEAVRINNIEGGSNGIHPSKN